MEKTSLLQQSNVPAGDKNDSLPISPYWAWLPTPVPPKSDRAEYEAARRAELDDVRRLDLHYRQLLGYLCPVRTGGDEHRGDNDALDRHDLSPQDREEHDRLTHELYLSHRFLVCAVEVYLLGCVEYPDLTGEGAVRRATNTDSLIATLQAEEDSMIETHGPPWAESVFPSNRVIARKPAGTR